MNRSSPCRIILLGASLVAASAFAQTLYTPGGAVGNITGGNVGIGTNSPINKLDVAGGVHFGSGTENISNTSKGLSVQDGSGGAVAMAVGATTGRSTGMVWYDGNPGSAVWYTFSNAAPITITGRDLHLASGGAERLTVANNGNVGIGTTLPGEPLEVAASGRAFFGDGGGAARKGLLIDAVEDGTYVRLHPYNYGTATSMNLVISPFGGGNVGIGTANPTNKLEVNGTIRTKEVIVETTGWSDYVFAPDYRLAPLSEVEASIKAEGHLPGIPSAAEIAEHGVSLGDMQAKLLAKMEEITLHMIVLSKTVDAQSARIAQLETENAALRTQ